MTEENNKISLKEKFNCRLLVEGVSGLVVDEVGIVDGLGTLWVSEGFGSVVEGIIGAVCDSSIFVRASVESLLIKGFSKASSIDKWRIVSIAFKSVSLRVVLWCCNSSISFPKVTENKPFLLAMYVKGHTIENVTKVPMTPYRKMYRKYLKKERRRKL